MCCQDGDEGGLLFSRFTGIFYFHIITRTNYGEPKLCSQCIKLFFATVRHKNGRA